ncbi:MAG: helix-turn-helix domain protein [Actinomycetia bacterium]|nr:helix-turn-helix domain protein [Actinomycetes bacterium]
MPEPLSPTVRRRRLAAELRRLREHAGMKGEEAARLLTWSAAKISRIETAKTLPKPVDVRKMLELYGKADALGEDLLTLAREADRKGWWEAYTDALPDRFDAFIGLEAEAEAACCWENDAVPGLFQTEEYARATVLAVQPVFNLHPGQVDARVEARMVRQAILIQDKPIELSVVADESVLLRRFGDRQVMRAQLERITAVAQLPNVTLRVLPLDGPHPVGAASFTLLRFAPVYDITFHDVVYAEQLTGALYIEEERETYRYAQSFDRLVSEALDPAKSLDLIARVAERTW